MAKAFQQQPLTLPKFNLFNAYTKKVKEFLQENAWLQGVPPEANVAVYHTTPPRAFVKKIIPLVNTTNLNPTISYRLANHELSINEISNGFAHKTVIDRENGTWSKFHNPLPYKLTYEVVIWTNRKTEMNQLLYQLMTAAPFNRKWASIMPDNQYVEVQVTDVADQTSTEPSQYQDVITRYGLNIVIPRAYLPFEHTQSDDFIEQWEVETGEDYDL